MQTKINYLRKWDAEGTHFNQTVTVSLTPAQIAEVNSRIGKLSFARVFGSRFFVGAGLNFVTLSAARIIADYIGANKNKRYKTNRNTVFNIIAA